MPTKPATASATSFVAEFGQKKITAGAIQYAQDPPANGERPAIGSLYLTKAELAKHKNTGRIRVTVEFIG